MEFWGIWCYHIYCPERKIHINPFFWNSASWCAEVCHVLCTCVQLPHMCIIAIAQKVFLPYVCMHVQSGTISTIVSLGTVDGQNVQQIEMDRDALKQWCRWKRLLWMWHWWKANKLALITVSIVGTQYLLIPCLVYMCQSDMPASHKLLRHSYMYHLSVHKISW